MLVGEKIWQLNSVVVDLLTLKLLIFRMVIILITYLGMPRLHQIALFLSKFSWGGGGGGGGGACPRTPLA